MGARLTRGLAGLTLGLSVLMLLGLAQLRFFSVMPLVAAAAVGCALYLFISRKPEPEAETFGTRTGTVARRRLKTLAAMLFFVLTALSLAVVASRPFEKPLAYLLLVSSSAAMVALYIGLIDRVKEAAGALAMILVLALNLFGSSQLTFPLGIGGADTPTHVHFLVLPIVEDGVVPQTSPCGLVYGSFPAHHVLVAMGSLLLAADPVRTYYGFGFLAMALPVLIVFAVARPLFGVRTALLASLFLAGASYYIFWASHAAPLTYAIPAISTLILVLLRSVRGIDSRLLLLALILSLSVILTHPYTSVIVGLVLLSVFVGQAIFWRGGRPLSWGTPIVGAVYGFALLFDWVNFSCMMTKSFQLAEGYYQTIAAEAIVSQPAVYDALPLSAIVVNTLGDSLLLALAVVGFFVLLSRAPSARHMLILGPMIALLGLSIVGLVAKLNYILPNRLYVYLQFLALAPLAAVGLWDLCRRLSATSSRRRHWTSFGIAAFLVGFFVLASSASTIAGFETSPLTGDRPYVKLYDTSYEERSADWLCSRNISSTRVETSLSYSGLARLRVSDCLAAQNTTVVKMILTVWGTIDVNRLANGSLIVFSYYDLDPGFQSAITGGGQFGRGVYQKFSPADVAPLAGFNKLYDNGPVEVFVVRR